MVVKEEQWRTGLFNEGNTRVMNTFRQLTRPKQQYKIQKDSNLLNGPGKKIPKTVPIGPGPEFFVLF